MRELLYAMQPSREEQGTISVAETELLDQLYLGYIELEACTSYSHCDLAGINRLNTDLKKVRQDVGQLGSVSASFVAKFTRFTAAHSRQAKRLVAQTVGVCPLSAPPGLPPPSWVAACAILALPLTPPTSPDCSAAFGEAVEPFLGCSTSCTLEVVFAALAAATDSTTCVSPAAAKAAIVIATNLFH